MPSLAIFLHQLSATGVARNALAIARHMQASGWRVTVITLRSGGDLAGLVQGVEHIVLGGAGLPRKLELMLAVPRLRRVLRQLSPDVLLSAGNHAHLTVLLAARDLDRTATIYRISNDLGHGVVAGGALAALSPRRRVMRRVIRHAAALVLVSPHLAADPLLGPQIASGKARIIGNGVDLELVRRRAAEPCPHPWAAEPVPIVLAVGRLARQKNHATLIDAFALARKARSLRLIIVGGGRRRMRKRLRQQIERLGVGQDVSLVGKFANPYPFLRVASVLALPSFWEGSPNVLLEALTCDCAIVASRTAGNAEDILENGRYGRLVDPLDVAAMSEALLAQLDPAERVSPGGRAEAYDRRHTLARYRELFDAVRNGAPVSHRT